MSETPIPEKEVALEDVIAVDVVADGEGDLWVRLTVTSDDKTSIEVDLVDDDVYALRRRLGQAMDQIRRARARYFSVSGYSPADHLVARGETVSLCGRRRVQPGEEWLLDSWFVGEGSGRVCQHCVRIAERREHKRAGMLSNGAALPPGPAEPQATAPHTDGNG